jgi:hypothetical protein
MYGLNERLVSARAVASSIGIAVSERWDDKRHAGRTSSNFQQRGQMVPYCQNVWSGFCNVGQIVGVDEEIVRDTFSPVIDGQKKMALRLYHCADAIAPNSAAFVDDGKRFQHVGTLEVAMPKGQDDPDHGLNRTVSVSFLFGGTEIQVRAVDQTSGTQVAAAISFLDRNLEGIPGFAIDRPEEQDEDLGLSLFE